MTTHRDVAHAWAHNLPKWYKGPNMFRDRTSGTIYSYWYHFPIARHVKPGILFTTRTYSPSTSKHIQYTRQAIPPDVTIFYVDNVMAETKDEHKSNYHRMVKDRNELLDKSVRATKYAYDFQRQAQTIACSLNAYTKAFKLGFHQIDTSISKEALAQIEADAKARDRKNIQKWLNFETNRAPSTSTPYVRVRNDMVETSMGVSVPLKRSLALYRLSKICKAHSRAYIPEKHQQIEGWKIDGIRPNGTLRVGCHSIPLTHQKLAAKLAGITL